MVITVVEKKIIAIIIVSYIALSLFNYNTIEEDAFIYFRCAENIASGYGYVFNQGGERTEFCSSWAWLFLLILITKLGLNIITFTKLLGILFGCIALVLIFKITKNFHCKYPWSVLPSLLTAINLPFLFWNQRGLDTPLYIVIILWLVLICLKKSTFKFWAIPSGLLLISRPEGFFVLTALIIPLYYFRENRREILLSMIAFILLWFTFTAGRLLYFNDIFPTPFYVKMIAGKPMGFVVLHDYFKNNYFYYFCIPLLGALWKRNEWNRERNILTGFIGILIIWFVLKGIEFKPYYRHLVPSIPLIFIFVITSISKYFSLTGKKEKILLGLYVLCFGLASLVLSEQFPTFLNKKNPVAENLQHVSSKPRDYIKGLYELFYTPFNLGTFQILVGEFVKKNYYEGSTLVHDQMGQTPFQAGQGYAFIDSWGITDKKIAHYYFYRQKQAKGMIYIYKKISSYILKNFSVNYISYSTPAILDYIFKQNPDVILMNKNSLIHRSKIAYMLFNHPKLKNDYNLKYLLAGIIFVFEKKELHAKQLTIPDELNVVGREEIKKMIKDNHFPITFDTESPIR